VWLCFSCDIPVQKLVQWQHAVTAITQRQRFKPSRRGVIAQARDAKRLRVRRKPSRLVLLLIKDQPQLVHSTLVGSARLRLAYRTTTA
jgi:hypothetical protein